MSIEWNPNAPTMRGMEHRDAGVGQQVINAAAESGWAFRFEGRHTGGIDQVDHFMGSGVSAPALDGRFNSLRRPIISELIDAGSEATGTVSMAEIAPDAIIASSGGTTITDQSGGAIAIGDITGVDDGAYLVGRVLNSYVDLSFDTAAFPLDRRILRIGFRVDTNATFRISRLDPVGSGFYYYKDIPALANSPIPWYTHFGEAKVDRGDSEWTWWTPQDIRDMRNSGGTRRWRFQCRAAQGNWRLDFVRMYVLWCTENRRGVGIAEASPTNYTWIPIDLRTPAGTGNPTVTTGGDYTCTLRRSLGYSVDDISTLAAPWRYMNGQPLASPDWESRPILVADPPGQHPFQQGAIQTTGLGEPVLGMFCSRFASGGAILPEAQPYTLQRGAKVFGINNQTSTTGSPSGGVEVNQYLQVSAPDVYGQAFVMVGRANILETGPLRVEVWDETLGTRIFSPVELTVDQWNDLPVDNTIVSAAEGYTWKRARFRFPESLSLAAGIYRIRMLAPDAAESRQWRIGAMTADLHSPDQTMGGSVDFATGFIGTGADEFTPIDTGALRSDVQALMATVPPAVTGVGVATGIRTAHHAQAPTRHTCKDYGCADQGSPFAHLTWGVTVDSASTYYQVQRMDDVDPDWKLVAWVDGRLSTAWDDEEVRIGARSGYRIRSGRDDGILGDWSDPVYITPPSGQVALTFTSNFATGAAVTLPEAWEDTRTVERNWTHNEYGDVQHRPIYGKDGQMAFHPLEKRGISFNRTLMLSAVQAVSPPTLQIAAPLHAIAWAPLPYVCVRDGEGNRFFASVEVPEITNRRMGERWFAEVTITEVTRIPAIVVTSEGQIDV